MKQFKLLSVHLPACFIFCLLCGYAAHARDFRITDFGARPGMAFLNTVAINKAIEACTKSGGGRVVIPAGLFRTGTIIMKDHVELYLENGSILMASTNIKDFPIQDRPRYRSQKDPPGWRSLIYANEASWIGISGAGT